jgi:hypothetical protein
LIMQCSMFCFLLKKLSFVLGFSPWLFSD